jgi:hypothetical protein
MLWVMTSRRSEIVHRVLELVEVMMLESRRTKPQFIFGSFGLLGRVVRYTWTWLWVVCEGVAVIFLYSPEMRWFWG